LVPITVIECPTLTGPLLGIAYSKSAGLTNIKSSASDLNRFLEIANWTRPALLRGVTHLTEDDVRKKAETEASPKIHSIWSDERKLCPEIQIKVAPEVNPELGCICQMETPCSKRKERPAADNSWLVNPTCTLTVQGFLMAGVAHTANVLESMVPGLASKLENLQNKTSESTKLPETCTWVPPVTGPTHGLKEVIIVS